MTFDLNRARELHDRSPHGADYCTTCQDGQGNMLPWPCDTAKALGATGRSEWLDAPAAGPSVTYNIQASSVNVTRLNTDGTPFELPSLDFSMESTLTPEETTALVDHLTRTTEPEVCDAKRQGGPERCTKAKGHDGNHLHHASTWAWLPYCGWRHPEQDWTCDEYLGHEGAHRVIEETAGSQRCTWVLRDRTQCDEAKSHGIEHQVPQCDRVSTSGRRCQLGLGHVDTFHDMDPEQCGHVSGEDSCTEVKGHIVNAALPHRSGPRTWWPTEACDGVGENTYLNCCLAKGHKLRCHFSYHDDTDLVRCCDPSRSETPCALPQAHAGSHADLDGLRWGPGDVSDRQDATSEPELCGSPNPMPLRSSCTLELGHTQLHDDRSGMRWSDDAEPPSLRNRWSLRNRCQEVTPSEVAPAGRRCARRWGHGNEHVTSNGEPWSTAEPQPEEAACTGRLSTPDGEIRCQLAAGHVGVHTRGDRTWNWRGATVDMCPEAGCAYVAGHVLGHRRWDGRPLS